MRTKLPAKSLTYYVGHCTSKKLTPSKMNFGGGGYKSESFGGGGGAGYGGGGGGGGFMQGSQSSPGFGQSPSTDSKKGRGARSQSLRPVTAAQIHSAEEMGGDNQFKIDNTEISQIVLVGEIMEVNESPTNMMYKIDDRTGPWVEVRKWMDENYGPDQQERAACREGLYVKVTGHLRSFNKQRSVIAFHIRPVEDFNEITHHLAEVMYSHLAVTKGVPVPQQFQQQAQSASSGWGAPMATSTQASGGGGGMYAGSRPDTGLSSVQQKVLNSISSSAMDQGVNIHDLIRGLSQHGHQEKAIRSAVEFLCNEGHIYSTIDDDHFKSTDQ